MTHIKEDPKGLLISSLQGNRPNVPRAEVERILHVYEAQRIEDAVPDVVEARAQRDLVRNRIRDWSDRIAAIQAQRPEFQNLSIEQLPEALLDRIIELESGVVARGVKR